MVDPELSRIRKEVGKKGGKIGGKSTSPAKLAACKKNAQKAGRPKTKTPSKWAKYKRKERAAKKE